MGEFNSCDYTTVDTDEYNQLKKKANKYDKMIAFIDNTIKDCAKYEQDYGIDFTGRYVHILRSVKGFGENV